MEVAEEEVCSSSAAPDGKTAWMEHLRQLHVEESQVRQQIQRETNHQHALQGIMKIEQDRLNGVSVVYREAMQKLDAKTSLALKNHARVSQDAQLVKLMQHSFNPILGDLLDKCEDALLNCFRKLSLRFEDFAQEFEYYRNALLSLMRSPGKDVPAVKGDASPVDAADLVMDDDSVTIKRENIAKVTSEIADTDPAASPEVVELVDDSEAIATEEGDEFDQLGDSSGLREAYITFYMGEMEALWKERSSSLEMVQAIQRSLLNNALEVASPAKAVVPQRPSKTKTSDDVEMKVEDEAAEEKTDESETEAQPEDKATEATSVEKSQEAANTPAETEKEADVKSDASTEVVVKTEPQEESGNFRREQELREAVESCLAQWQRIQWPEELNSTFLAPTTPTSSNEPAAIKSELIKTQSTIGADGDDSEYESPYSVMDELKRVMIDLTQDQVVPVPPPVEPTTLVVYHPVFINHQTPKNHPECPERMDVSAVRYQNCRVGVSNQTLCVCFLFSVL